MVIEVEHVHIAVAGRDIVHDVSMHVADGERVGLVGASGSGKSMLLKAMMGLLPRDCHVRGSIRVCGREVVGASDGAMADLRGRVMAMVDQDPSRSLNPASTALRQVMLPLALHYDLSAAQRRERALAALRSVGLDESVAGVNPHRLSGGQQQRVAIATALVGAPRLMLADEPTTALDPLTQRAVVDMLVGLVESAGVAMLFVTHDVAVLSRMGGRCYVMEGGRIVDQGSVPDLLGHPKRSATRALVDASLALGLRVGGTEARRGPSDDMPVEEMP